MNGPIHEVPRSRPAGAKRGGIAFEQVAEEILCFDVKTSTTI